MRKLLTLLTAFLLLTGWLFAHKTITDRVSDDKRNPIHYASIGIKDTNTDTESKSDVMKWTVNVLEINEFKLFSYVLLLPIQFRITQVFIFIE